MDSCQIFKYLTVMALLVLCRIAIAQDDPPTGFHGEERDALLTLKAEFNNPVLNSSWKSLMCYQNDTPNWYGIQCLNGRVTGIVLESIALNGEIKVDAIVNLTELSILNFKNNSISGSVMDLSNNKKLTQIDLSGNKFDGPIPPSLLTLNLLESLQLQDNSLTGSIPMFNQSTLRQFNVSNNDLSGEIPNTPVLQSFDFSSYNGNQDLCGPPSSTSCSSSNARTASDYSNKFHLAAIILVVALFVIVLLFSVYCKKSRQLKKLQMKKQDLVLEEEEKDEMPIEAREKGVVEGQEKGNLIFMNNEMHFDLGDLLKASADGLGKGNFGNCYKAMLDDLPAVVVKRLRDLKPLGNDEFAVQLGLIADQKHPNLLPILACYYSKDEKLLLYKFASNGNVYNRLHGGKGTKDRIPFRWSSRLHVARGVARALEYLHLNPKLQPFVVVPHGNLKSSNVLLDENDMVLVSDYGMTSIIAPSLAAQRMVSYRSPEYKSYKKVSKKSDVWSYGSLLLELLTGRIPSHSAPQDMNGVDVCSWVHRAVREEWTAEIFDMEISVERGAHHGMLKLLQIAIKCVDRVPENWPEISEVVREVENIKNVVDSEEEEDFSLDPSLTDESISATPSIVVSGDKR